MARRSWWKLWCKEVAARTIVAVGLGKRNTATQRARLGGRRLLIVSYHRVVSDFRREVRLSIPGLLIADGTLRRQLEELGRLYDVVPLGRALHDMRTSRTGPDLASVTFDDGYADVAHVGLPVLQQLKIPATVFLATGFVGTGRALPHDRLFAGLRALDERRLDPATLPASGGRDWLCALRRGGLGEAEIVDALISTLTASQLLSLAADLEQLGGLSANGQGGQILDWELVRSLVRAGLALGAHTVHHSVLTRLPQPIVRAELVEARRAIREHAGVDPLDFAYPNGWYSAEVVSEVEAAGYRCAVTTEARHNGTAENPFRLGRFSLWEGSSCGPLGFSRHIACCQLEGSFEALGVRRMASGRMASPAAADLSTPAAMLRIQRPEGAS